MDMESYAAAYLGIKRPGPVMGTTVAGTTDFLKRVDLRKSARIAPNRGKLADRGEHTRKGSVSD
jgi:hypothetical protein